MALSAIETPCPPNAQTNDIISDVNNAGRDLPGSVAYPQHLFQAKKLFKADYVTNKGNLISRTSSHLDSKSESKLNDGAKQQDIDWSPRLPSISSPLSKRPGRSS